MNAVPPATQSAIPEVDPSLEKRFPIRRDIVPNQPASGETNALPPAA
ncbi:hypothetical protein C7S15_3240 [Burkholderia cepacia]|nr:hypothetical protein [Burkholderia cepacia]